MGNKIIFGGNAIARK